MAQCLLTYYDFNNEESRQNIKGAIETLLRNGYIPIINENDTVAVDEIKFGDNDKLAAHTASLLDVDVLILAPNTDGVFIADPKNNPDAEIITSIHELSEVHQFITDGKSAQGSGGMKSKLQDAAIAQYNEVDTWILNGGRKNFLTEALKNESTFTKVVKGDYMKRVVHVLIIIFCGLISSISQHLIERYQKGGANTNKSGVENEISKVINLKSSLKESILSPFLRQKLKIRLG